MSLMGSCGERDCIINSIYNYVWNFITSVHVWSTYIEVFIIYSAVYHRVFWFIVDLHFTQNNTENISRNQHVTHLINYRFHGQPNAWELRRKTTTNAFSFLIFWSVSMMTPLWVDVLIPLLTRRERQRESFTWTFMHLAYAFIQSDLQCIQAIRVLSVCVFSGNWAWAQISN